MGNVYVFLIVFRKRCKRLHYRIIKEERKNIMEKLLCPSRCVQITETWRRKLMI